MINTKDLRNVLHFSSNTHRSFHTLTKERITKKALKKRILFALRFREMPASCRFVNTQKPDVALLINPVCALQKIGLEIITDFSISLCSTTTLFTTSFRSCCMAYFKDKGEKLSRRKIDGIFFAIIFSWFTNIAYAILRLTMILSLELHNQIVIDAWH